MPSTEILITFALAALIMNLSPGPSNLYVMARSIAQGSKAGVAASLGLALGSLFHVVAAALGLAAIFSHSPEIYIIVKLIGAGYLIYLGIRYWRSKPISPNKNKPAIKPKPKSLNAIFRESVFVEITNPKTALFFIAFLPQFVTPEAGPITQQLLIFGLIVTVSALPCDLFIALFSSKASTWLLQHEKAQLIQERVSGSILVGMGTYIIVDEAVAD